MHVHIYMFGLSLVKLLLPRIRVDEMGPKNMRATWWITCFEIPRGSIIHKGLGFRA